MDDDIYVIGASWLGLDDASDLQLDEAVFEASSAALRDAGVKRHQVELSVTSSLDLYDGRSISSALTAPAAAGYLNDETRIEGDASAAFLVAAAGILSNQADVAIVTAINAPEVGTTSEIAVRRLREQVSSYTFDSHLDRPVGMSSTATLGMQAGFAIDSGHSSWEQFVTDTTAAINRGAASGRSARSATTETAVRESPMAAAPLTQLMLPADSAGVGAVILAGSVIGRRSPRRRARLKSWGSATGVPSWSRGWLDDPAAATRHAATKAYRRAGIHSAEIGHVEMMDLSPSLSRPLLSALQAEHLGSHNVNRAGGVRSNHPGVASGLLRIIEATEAVMGDAVDGYGVVHATDDLMGLVSATTSVLVLEAP